MNKYYIILLVFWVFYLILDIIEYYVLQNKKNMNFKNYFDYKLNYKKRLKEKEQELKHRDNSNAGDNNNL